ETKEASPTLLAKMAELADKDDSAVVRLYLASALQKLPLEARPAILKGLVRHAEDADDHNLPLMYWYAAEPLAAKDPRAAYDLVAASPITKLAAFMTRRIGASGTPQALEFLVGQLSGSPRDRMILGELKESLKGRRRVTMPKSWTAAFAVLMKSGDANLREQALSLAVVFGDAQAFDRLRELLRNVGTDAGIRKNALDALVAARDPGLPPMLLELLETTAMRDQALRALASYDDPKTPIAVLKLYPKLNPAEKRDALNTLASRAGYGKSLLDAVADKSIASTEISADLVRQLRNLNDPALDRRINEVWGLSRATPADKLKLIAQMKQTLSAPHEVDLPLGRAVFAKTCQQCHTLYGIGGKVGPDITGSNRANLDYLLENIVDPSAVIPKEYAASVLTLSSGRIITGIVKSESGQALQVQTANELLTIPKTDVEGRVTSKLSMMPDDLLKPLSSMQVRSLVAYLRNPTQTTMAATKENAKDFFDGKSLAGWDDDAKLWHVENGELVGKSPGIARNEFLRSHMTAGDFRLTLKVKLVPDAGNSGVQFRSERLQGSEMKGPQADIGAGWWGKLYEENNRGLIFSKPGDQHVKKNDWNDYEIIARGPMVKTYLNGHLCVDLTDPEIARRGIFALQIHSGPAMEVRYKDLRLEVYDP
ncbi:MAG TPA: family 16 glycoside hydrolase, partial [Gemmataceae bacterium]|nr:family 16 glycoside hydrolase [Gemmataceae bacterium]